MSESYPDPIKVPYPKVEDLHLSIAAPVCTITIAPGLGNAWVNGLYHDPKEVAPISIDQSGNATHIVAMGAFSYRAPRRYIPRMKLSFGRTKPFSLAISAGSMPSHFDFGGIPLKDLEIRFAGGDQVVDFSYPNPEPMHRFKVEADTGLIQIENLINANVGEVRLEGDTTKYRVNFAGELKQNTTFFIGMSVSRADLFIPANTAVIILTSNTFSTGEPTDFVFQENAYWNESARNHQEPVLHIRNNTVLGQMHLHFV